jgi:hypothetical protein
MKKPCTQRCFEHRCIHVGNACKHCVSALHPQAEKPRREPSLEIAHKKPIGYSKHVQGTWDCELTFEAGEHIVVRFMPTEVHQKGNESLLCNVAFNEARR